MKYTCTAGSHVASILHWLRADMWMFRKATNKLFEWLFPRVLASHRGSDYQQVYVNLRTSSLGWKWPWSSLFIISLFHILAKKTWQGICWPSCRLWQLAALTTGGYFFPGGSSRPVPGLWWPYHDWAAGAHDAGGGIRHHDHRLLAREARHQQNS